MLRLSGLMMAMLMSVSVCAQDVYRVTFGEDVLEGPTSGRLRLFIVTAQGSGWAGRDPLEGPFFSEPQPIASIELNDVVPGQTIDLYTRHMDTFPEDLETLSGPVRLRAIFDWQEIERSATDEPGNPVSGVVEIELHAGADDVVAIAMDSTTQEIELPPETSTLRWVVVRSEMLSEFYGRDVYHRAGVILPEIVARAMEDGSRVVFPAVYVVPGFGGRHTSAVGIARRIASDREYPEAVTIVLDAESPLGHHGFVDSPNHGPRGTALVRELIPELERRFKLDARPGARIVTGHSSGGWSSLWLQLHWPEVFGACWSSAPDPVDFNAFQRTNIYTDASMFVESDGSETTSYRQFRDGKEVAAMSVRQENQMEFAMDPGGGSGQQWDAWEAMFSPRDETLGMPRQMFDAQTGAIDHEVAEEWKRFDIAQIVMDDWDRYGPILTERVRLAVGTHDSFYLNRAVERLSDVVGKELGNRAVMDSRPPERRPSFHGYIWLVEGATHGSIHQETRERWDREMRAFLGQPTP